MYSRKWNPVKQEEWIDEASKRFPTLAGRLYTIDVPDVDEKGSFRDPQTGVLIKEKVSLVLGLTASGQHSSGSE